MEIDLEEGTVSYINDLHTRIQRFLNRSNDVDISPGGFSMGVSMSPTLGYVRKTEEIGRVICSKLSIVKCDTSRATFTHHRTIAKNYRLVHTKLS